MKLNTLLKKTKEWDINLVKHRTDLNRLRVKTVLSLNDQINDKWITTIQGMLIMRRPPRCEKL